MVGARTSRSARYGQVVFVLLAVTVSMLAGPVNVRSVSAQVALAPSTPAPTPTLAPEILRRVWMIQKKRRA